jgi:methyltransferase (TIGR00027 family)
MEGFDAVARTALLTAALRAKETTRPDRLYADPYAAKLAAEVGPHLFGSVSTVTVEKRAEPEPTTGRRLPNTADYNAIRTRFFDEYLLSAVAGSPSPQVVVAAAGMDTRAYRLPWPAPVEIFELDRPAVLAVKHAALDAERPASGVTRRPVAVDLLAPGWPRALAAAGYDPGRPSVWLLEGLLYYIDEKQVRRLLADVRDVTAAGSRVAADLVNAVALTSPVMRPLLAVFEGWGSPWLFGSDEPEKLFAEYGVDATAVQPGEPAADFGRWRDPVHPRDVPGIERVFYIEGVRI